MCHRYVGTQREIGITNGPLYAPDLPFSCRKTAELAASCLLYIGPRDKPVLSEFPRPLGVAISNVAADTEDIAMLSGISTEDVRVGHAERC